MCLFCFVGAKGPESGSRELTTEREGGKVFELVKHDCLILFSFLRMKIVRVVSFDVTVLTSCAHR